MAEPEQTLNNNARAIVLTHIADLDGVASGVLLWYYLLYQNSKPPEVFFVDYDNCAEILEQEAPTASEVYIADISLRNPALIKCLEHLGKENVYIFDHHASSRPTFKLWEDRAQIWFDDSHQKCTADLIWEFGEDVFVRYNEALHDLKKFTHSADLWIRDQVMGEKLSDVIAVLGARYLFEKLTNQPEQCYYDNFTPDMMRASLQAEGRREQSKLIAKNTAYSMDIDGVKLTVALAAGASSHVGQMFIDEEPLSWVALIDIQGLRVSFRTNENTINKSGISVSDIAGYFGGGGHPVASGAPLTEVILQNGTKSFAENIAKVIHSTRALRAELHATKWLSSNEKTKDYPSGS